MDLFDACSTKAAPAAKKEPTIAGSRTTAKKKPAATSKAAAGKPSGVARATGRALVTSRDDRRPASVASAKSTPTPAPARPSTTASTARTTAAAPTPAAAAPTAARTRVVEPVAAMRTDTERTRRLAEIRTLRRSIARANRERASMGGESAATSFEKAVAELGALQTRVHDPRQQYARQMALALGMERLQAQLEAWHPPERANSQEQLYLSWYTLDRIRQQAQEQLAEYAAVGTSAIESELGDAHALDVAVLLEPLRRASATRPGTAGGAGAGDVRSSAERERTRAQEEQRIWLPRECCIDEQAQHAYASLRRRPTVDPRGRPFHSYRDVKELQTIAALEHQLQIALLHRSVEARAAGMLEDLRAGTPSGRDRTGYLARFKMVHSLLVHEGKLGVTFVHHPEQQ